MKIKKGELIKALEISKRFIAKSSSNIALQRVYLDADRQRVFATDTTAFLSYPLDMREADIEYENPGDWPTEDLREKLSGLLKADLETMCADLEISLPKKTTKDQIITAIIRQKMIEADEKSGEKETMPVQICVDPGKLLEIVRSLDVSSNDDVGLSFEDIKFPQDGGKPYPHFLSIDGLFRAICVYNPTMFPSQPEYEGPYAKVLEGGGDTFKFVLKVPLPESAQERDFMKTIALAGFEIGSCLAATDGSRLHSQGVQFENVELARKKRWLFPAYVLRNMQTVMKSDANQRFEMHGSDNSSWVWFKMPIGFNNEKADLFVIDQSELMDFPDFKEVLKLEFDKTAVIKSENLKALLKQAKVLANSEYHGVELVFNGGLSACMNNPLLGDYQRENFPFEENSHFDPEITVAVSVELLSQAMNDAYNNVKIGLKPNDDNEVNTPIMFDIDLTSPSCGRKAFIMPMRV